MAEGGLQLSWMDYHERYLNLDSSRKKEVSDIKVVKPRKEILRLDFGFTLVTFCRADISAAKVIHRQTPKHRKNYFWSQMLPKFSTGILELLFGLVGERNAVQLLPRFKFPSVLVGSPTHFDTDTHFDTETQLLMSILTNTFASLICNDYLGNMMMSLDHLVRQLYPLRSEKVCVPSFLCCY